MDCPFCAEIADPRHYRLVVNRHWPFDNRILYRNEKALIIPGHGPQVYPYALVLSQVHQPAYAQLEGGDQIAMRDCLKHLLITGFFGPTLSVFEHGGTELRGASSGCQCINHCHLHVIGGEYPVANWFHQDYDGPLVRQDNFGVTVNNVPVRDYLFAGYYHRPGNEDFRFEGWVGKCERRESQYFRRLLAQKLNHRQWDWRHGMNHEHMRCLYQQIVVPGVSV